MSSDLRAVKQLCCEPSSERMRSVLLPADSRIYVPQALRRAPSLYKSTMAAVEHTELDPCTCLQKGPAATAGPFVSATGGAMMNLPPFSGQMGTDAWMGPGGSIPALRPGSALTPGTPSSLASAAATLLP